jgi:hypothetical protein
MERGLSNVGGPVAAGCKNLTAPPASSGFAAIGKLQMDQLVSAFACNHTRVATLMWSGSNSSVVPPGVVSAERNYHEVSHHTDPTSLAVLTNGETWYMKQLAYLAGAMDAIPDGPGTTLLDNTTILTVSEISAGASHSFVNMPFVLVGGCGGSIRTGRFLSGINRAHNDLYISLLNAMGIPETTFGDPTYVKGPIPGLVG